MTLTYPRFMRELNESGVATLEAIGPRGAPAPHRVEELGLSESELLGLVYDGYLYVHRIPPVETQPRAAAAQAHNVTRVYMLTQAGAEAIGIDRRGASGS